MIDPELSKIRKTKSLPTLNRGPVSGQRDVIVRMFLRSYARMEVLHKRASYYQLHAYASYGPFIMLFCAGLALSSVLVLLLFSAYPSGTVNWARSLWTWLLIGLPLVWVVDKLISRRIAHIPKGERPAGIEEFHSRRERLKLVAELVALISMFWILHACLSRIYFA